MYSQHRQLLCRQLHLLLGGFATVRVLGGFAAEVEQRHIQISSHIFSQCLLHVAGNTLHAILVHIDKTTLAIGIGVNRPRRSNHMVLIHLEVHVGGAS